MEDEEIEYTLFNKRECSVYKIPPASSSSGHKAGDWKQCIWQGRIRIVGKGKDLYVRLLDANSGSLFAQCVIPEGDHAKYVERTIDSSRYFVLKIQNGQRHAFIGLGFEDRNDAFDFNCTLNEFKTTWIDRENQINESTADHVPSKDLSLKEGQKITINLRGLAGEGAAKKKEKSSEVGGPINLLAPPPPAGVSRRAVAAANAPAATTTAPPAATPPLQAPSVPAAKQQAAQPLGAAQEEDPFGDFEDFQSADFQAAAAPAPAPAPAPAASTPAPTPVAAVPMVAPAATAPVATDNGVAGVAPLFQQMSLGGKGGGYNPAPAAAAPAPQPFDPFAGMGSAPAVAPAPAPSQMSMPSQQSMAAVSAKPAPSKKPYDPFDEFDIFR